MVLPRVSTPVRRVGDAAIYDSGFVGVRRGPAVSALLAWAANHDPQDGEPSWLERAPAYVPLALPFEQLVFTQPGRYEWAVTLDDEPVGAIPLEVVLAPGGAMEEQAGGPLSGDAS